MKGSVSPKSGEALPPSTSTQNPYRLAQDRPGARAWLKLLHLARNRHLPNFDAPRTFNELVQARKLKDRNPLLPRLADKVLVKHYVADRLGPDWVIPTLWHGRKLPGQPPWPRPFVVKSNHGSQQCLFVRSESDPWPPVKRKAEKWLNSRYAWILGEWLYGQIEPQILVEPFIGSAGSLPVDYKFFVFGGRAAFVQVDTDREHAHKRTLFNLDWERLPVRFQYPIDTREIAPPATLVRMIEAAETLGHDFDFVRVDFYEVGERPLFGEMTFYPGSGLDRFAPASADLMFGQPWLEARGRLGKSVV
jgi:hypothetical protein